MKEFVVVVDREDNELGTMEKMEAHETGTLHRAFSVFVFNSNFQMLIHRRAFSKYHSAGLWTNTCCSHQRPGETTLDAAHRRLKEEMGFDCDLTEQFTFIYKTAFDNSLTEHELDHAITGEFDGMPSPNPKEVCEWKYVDIDNLIQDISAHPDKYTVWFKIAFDKLLNSTLKSKIAV